MNEVSTYFLNLVNALSKKESMSYYQLVRLIGSIPKCKLFLWLVTQNRIWMADRLNRRGWDNHGRCKLCNFKKRQHTSSSNVDLQHIFGLRSCGWAYMIHDIYPLDCHLVSSIKEWFMEEVTIPKPLSPWWCSSHGRYGMGEMRGCSEDNIPLWRWL